MNLIFYIWLVERYTVQNIPITSTYNKFYQILLHRLLDSTGRNQTPLHYPVTQSLLPNPFKPQLYHIQISQLELHTHTINNLFPPQHKCSNYGLVISFFYLFSKWVIILLLPIYIFFYRICEASLHFRDFVDWFWYSQTNSCTNSSSIEPSNSWSISYLI